MAEEVETGGTKKFVYPKNYTPSISEEKRREIEFAYLEAENRKKRERKTRIIAISGIIILILIILAFILL